MMHQGVVKVLAKGRATSETQQGEIDRSVHTPLYRPVRLPLCPAHFGVTTNYIVSPNNRRPNNRRSSVFYCKMYRIYRISSVSELFCNSWRKFIFHVRRKARLSILKAVREEF